ncbi:FG-GAP-like repeat-containing protein [Psychroserpens sp. SPM9]|uniref:FG-GAP-like repeat-containing protein n=1 Tax=Psychroserpens sp. SPM9 TaxID=2975598 RepID=UPI0021A90F4F|nr:FG-GAP-like repeat-containing protein [Psychroserpens sp. SPM9]MDG5491716.1 FG-GAP-like repeat-containing protein [Psychroserpens sp. SPM9]
MKTYYLSTCFVLFSMLLSFSQIEFENQAGILNADVATGDTYLGNGVSFCDFDNDGWDDITLATADGDGVRFLKNVNGSFVDVNLGLGYLSYETKSVTWVDFDNDGDKDLFVTSETEGNKLIENLGDMTFQDITSTTGMSTNNLYTYGASWGDYNNDGFLDVFLSNRTLIVPNKLYRNNGNGTFSDVSLFSGIDPNPLFSFCSAFLDINNDGFQDIYVSNDKLSFLNKLYKNNGDGTFEDISMSSGTDISADAMSVTVGDYNKDGWFDIYVTNTQGGNYLLRNNGDETFTNVAGPTGTSFNSIGWGAVFFDADNNTDLDLYVSGEFDGSTGGYLSAAFYQNNGNYTFALNNSCFPNDNRESYSNAIGDIDNDGFMDVVVTNSDDMDVFLWKNMTVNTSNWIKLNLTGTISNTDGIGSRIELSVNGQKQYGYTHLGEGYMSQNSKTKHFGLHDATVIDYIKITWLSGIEETYYNIPANQTLNLIEGSTLSVDTHQESISYVFPNPVKDVFKIYGEATIKSITIVDVLGRKVKEVSNPVNNTINVSTLNPGHYMLIVETNDGKINHKFIKQ